MVFKQPLVLVNPPTSPEFPSKFQLKLQYCISQHLLTLQTRDEVSNVIMSVK